MGTAAKKKTPTRKKKPERKLTRGTMIDLYEARQYLGLDTLKETGLRMPVEVYFKDPAVAADASKAPASTTNSRRLGSRGFATARPAHVSPSSTTTRPTTC